MATPTSADHFDLVDAVSTESTGSLSIFGDGSVSSAVSSTSNSVCSTPARIGSSGNRTRSRRSSVAPVLPLSVSTRSMARSGSLANTKPIVKSSASRAGKTSARKLAVLDENGSQQPTAIRPTGTKRKALAAPLVASRSTRSLDIHKDIGKTAGSAKTLNKIAGGAREPLKMTRDLSSNVVDHAVKQDTGAGKSAALPVEASLKSKATASALVKATKRSSDIADGPEEGTRNKRPRMDIMPGEADPQRPSTIYTTSQSIPHGNTRTDDTTEQDEEEDEPVSSRFASLRHRPPTPPRIWAREERRKSMHMIADPVDGENVPMEACNEHAEGQQVRQEDAGRRESSVPGQVTSRSEVSSRYLDSPGNEDVSMSPPQSTTPAVSPLAAVSHAASTAVPLTSSRLTGSQPSVARTLPNGPMAFTIAQSPRRLMGASARLGTPRKMAPLPRSALSHDLFTPLALPSSPDKSMPASTAGLPDESQSDTLSGRSDTPPAGKQTTLMSWLSKGSPAISSITTATRQPQRRVVSSSGSRALRQMAPPALPVRSLRSSSSSRTLASASEVDTAAAVFTKVAPAVSASGSGSATLPRSSTLLASTISSAAKTSLPPPAGASVGAGPSKRAPLGEIRRPGMSSGGTMPPAGAGKTGAATRKPSYPSSLSVGNGQPGTRSNAPVNSMGPPKRIGRPRDRTVSVPVPASVLESFRSDGPGVDVMDGGDPQRSPDGVTVVSTLDSGSPRRSSPTLGLSRPGTGLSSPSRRTVSAPVRRVMQDEDDDPSPDGAAHNPLSSSTSALGRGRESLGLSMSERRSGAAWNDTSKSFVGLAAALERLKRKDSMVGKGVRASLGVGAGMSDLAGIARDAGPSSAGRTGETSAAKGDGAGSVIVSDRLAAVHRPRHSIAIAPATSRGRDDATASIEGAGLLPALSVGASAGPSAISSLLASTKSTSSVPSDSLGMPKSASTGRCLKGVVAHVDVWTADGTDSSAIFEDMLRTLGARVLARPSDSVTHLIYKSGKPSTLTWYRKQAAAAAEAAEEAEYQARLDQEARMDTEIAGSGPSDLGVKVEPDQMGTGGKKQVGPYIVGLSWVTRCKAEGKRVDEAKYAVDVKEEDVFGKRRKSMEPKSMSLADRLSAKPSRLPLSTMSQVAEAKRKSMLYAPKIGSPLKKTY